MTDANATRQIPVPDHGKILCIAFRPDGLHLVTGQSSGHIRQWNVDSGEEYSPFSMKSSDDVYAVATSMDGRWIVSGDKGNKVIAWDAVTHRKEVEVSENTSCINAVDVSSDSTRMASGSQDGKVLVLDILSGARVIPPLRHTTHVVGVKFSPDGFRIATAIYQDAVVIYDAQTGNKLSGISIPQVPSPLVAPLAWSSNGRQLFIGTSDKIISFDTSTFYRSEWQHKSADSPVIVAHDRFIVCCAGPSILFWDYALRMQVGDVGQTASHAPSPVEDRTSHKTSGINRKANHISSPGYRGKRSYDSLECDESQVRVSFDWISISHDGRYLAYGVCDGGLQVRSLAGLLSQAYANVPQISRIRLMQMSNAVLASWERGNPTETESILSREITQLSSPSHHTLSARSLIRSHLGEWETALEDAELSLKTKRSPIGRIARCISLIGVGKQEAALDDFDFVFHGANSNDIILLLVIKSILMFMCGKRTEAISRLQDLITASNEDQYILVLVNLYLKQRDYENAVRTLGLAKEPSMFGPLKTISFIFNWDFDNLAATTWYARCKSLYTSGFVKELGETLEEMVGPLAQNEKEPAHGHILQDLVTRTGDVTLLAWIGQSSACNSCLPSSPAVYGKSPFVPPCLEGDELMKRMDELRSAFPLGDAMMIHGRVTRLQPIRFARFRFHLPCIVFHVTSLQSEPEGVYHAETVELGNVQFTTTDSLPLKHPRRLVFVDLRIHGLQNPAVSWDDTLSSDVETVLDAATTAVTDTEAVHVPTIEEVPSTSSDPHTRALELIANLGQPFSALLLLQQPEGVYKRVAADHEIIIGGMGNNVPKDIRVEVLEIL